MSLAIPKSISEVTDTWLSDILGGEVTGFEVTFLEGGVLSDAFKIHNIEYTDNSQLPQSVVLKITTAKKDQRAVALGNRTYMRVCAKFASLKNLLMKLVEDYRLGFILWWMALITLGAATLPTFETPEGERMKALWGQGLQYMFQAIDNHDCYGMVQKILSKSK